MSWPSGTKAVTTNVDAGTDSVTSARGDIKQNIDNVNTIIDFYDACLLYTSPSPRDGLLSRMPSSA